jgi:hypothetical protein
LVLPKCAMNFDLWAFLNTFSFKALSLGKYIYLTSTTISSSRIWKGFSTPNFTLFLTLSTSMFLRWTSKTLSWSKNHTLNWAKQWAFRPYLYLGINLFQFH